MEKKVDRPTTSASKVTIYETTAPLLEAMRDELRELAKKKPEATLNKTKVTMINRLLVDVQQILKDESDSKYLDLLDEDALPQYSDVVIILSQFSAAMNRFRARYYYTSGRDGNHMPTYAWSIR
jgi:hypothetical protein